MTGNTIMDWLLFLVFGAWFLIYVIKPIYISLAFLKLEVFVDEKRNKSSITLENNAYIRNLGYKSLYIVRKSTATAPSNTPYETMRIEIVRIMPKIPYRRLILEYRVHPTVTLIYRKEKTDDDRNFFDTERKAFEEDIPTFANLVKWLYQKIYIRKLKVNYVVKVKDPDTKYIITGLNDKSVNPEKVAKELLERALQLLNV